MFINLHKFVLTKLSAREVPWTKVARDTDMSYETLKKIASGRTPNPGVQHVQKLANYFHAGLPVAQTMLPAPANAMPEINGEAVETVAPAKSEIKDVPAAVEIYKFNPPGNQVLITDRRTGFIRRAEDRERLGLMNAGNAGQGV